MARIASLDIHFHVNDIVRHLKVIYYHYYLYTGQYWFILHAKFVKIDKKVDFEHAELLISWYFDNKNWP